MGRIPFNETEEEKLAREREDSIKNLQSKRRRLRKQLLDHTKSLVFYGMGVARAQDEIDSIDSQLSKLKEENL